MEKPFIEIDAENIIMHPQEAHPIEGFKFSVNEENGKQFPYCCSNHTVLYNRALKWFTRFPNCCEAHKKFATKPFFKKSLYDGVAERILNQCSYTLSMIQDRINNDDWYEDITDYIEYNIKCFGHPAVGLHIYIEYVEANIKNNKIISDVTKQEKLLQFLDTYFSPKEKEQKEKTDINVLFEIYQKWLKIFPFEISFLSHLKPHFEKTIPLLREKGKTNRYTGLTIYKPHTKRSLIDILTEVTNTLLTQINTYQLYNKGILNEPERIKLELIVNERKLKLDKGYINKSATEEQRYRKILKEWFEDEKKFIDEVTPLLKLLPKAEQANTTIQPQQNENRTLILIQQHIEAIDTDGWKYSFYNENEYNAFTGVLTAYFEQNNYQLPEEVIRLKRRCKTKLGKAFGEILRELGNKDKLKDETGYFDIIRKLNHFEKESDLYKTITR